MPATKPDATPVNEAPNKMAELQEYHDRTAELVKEIAKAQSKCAQSSAKAKADKEAVAEAIEELHSFIREWNTPRPLLDAAEAKAKQVEKASEPEPWQEVPVAALCEHGLSPALAELLSDQGFKTLGHLAEWSKAGNHLTDIAGVGARKAEAIESALDQFWAATNAAQGPATMDGAITSQAVIDAAYEALVADGWTGATAQAALDQALGDAVRPYATAPELVAAVDAILDQDDDDDEADA